MTVRLEQLADGSVADRNFQALARFVLDTGGVTAGARWGTGTVTWPGGSPFTSTLTLAHGLGKAPVVAVATPQLAGASQVCSMNVVTFDATNVQWRGYATDDTSPAAAVTKIFYWLVIG
jgi:hypothetical protein